MWHVVPVPHLPRHPHLSKPHGGAYQTNAPRPLSKMHFFTRSCPRFSTVLCCPELFAGFVRRFHN